MLTQAQIEEMWVRSTHMRRTSEGLLYFKESKKKYMEEYWRFDSYEEYLNMLRTYFSPRVMAEDYVEEHGREFPRFIKDEIIEKITPGFADIPAEILAEAMNNRAEFLLVYNNPKDLAKDFGLENILEEIEGMEEIDGFGLEYANFILGMNGECTLKIPVAMSLKDYYSQEKSWKTAYCHGGEVYVVSAQGYRFSIPAYEINAENAEIDWKNPLDATSFLSFEEDIFSKAGSIELRALIEIEIARVKKGEK